MTEKNNIRRVLEEWQGRIGLRGEEKCRMVN
jgi:hypothetical protein